MKLQLSVIIMLFALILEFVEFNKAYKITRPYKFYNHHSWRPPRWHPLPKPRKHYYSKKIQPSKYHHYEPDYYRYAPHYEESDTYDDNMKPYVIIIQFPTKKEKKPSYHSHERQHVINSHPQDSDYIEDDKDHDELKVYEFDEKGVQIKINH